MKKLLSILLAIILLLATSSVGVMASNASSPEEIFYYSVEPQGARINAIDTSVSGEVIIPETLGGHTVVYVGGGYNMFQECTNLTGIVVPGCVITVGRFAYCYSLKSVKLEEGVRCIGSSAFSYCENLEKINLPDSLEYISASAFSYCKKIKSVVIPKNVTSIEANVFSYSGVEEIKVSTENPYYHSNNNAIIDSRTNKLIAGRNNTVIPDYVIGIERCAFAGCSKMEDVVLNANIVEIKDYAFENCSSIKNVWYTGNEEDRANIIIGVNNTALTNAVWHYNTCAQDAHVYASSCAIKCENCDWQRNNEAEHTFDGYRDLECNLCGEDQYEQWGTVGDCTWIVKDTEMIIFGDGSMGDSRNWNGNSVITKVTIEDGVENIPNSAFYFFTELSEVTIPDSVTSIGSYAFEYCSNLEKIIIPNSVITIGYGAFESCSKLETIIMPNSVTSIGGSAFEGCTNLKTVVISNKITNIQYDTFKFCSNLKNVIMPNSVNSIGARAFDGCANIAVWYSGSEASRNNITFSSYNEEITSCEWMYNICDYDKHIYINACDFTCENCDWVRRDVGHQYTNEDDVCAICQQVRLCPDYFNVTYTDLVFYGQDLKKENLKVTYKNDTLVKDTDYLLKSEKFSDKIMVTVLGIGKYEGNSYSIELLKTQIDLSKATITVSDGMFTGKPVTPTVTVSIDGVQLVKNTDYTISYYNNTTVGDDTAGVIIVGKGNYCGYAEKKFSITDFKPTITSDSLKNYYKTSVTIKGGYLEMPECLKNYEVKDSSGNLVETKSYNAPGAMSAKVYFPKTGTYTVTYYTQGSDVMLVAVSGGGYQYRYTYKGVATKQTVTVYYTAAASTPATVSPTRLTPSFEIVDYKTMLLNVSDKQSNANLDGIEWTISDSNIATINDNGILDLKSAGETVVTANIDGIMAKFDLNIAPLTISSKGKILEYDISSNSCVVAYDGQILREGIDYTHNIETKGDSLVLTINGKNLFQGTLIEYYYAKTGNKYCSNGIELLALPNKLEYIKNRELLDLTGIRVKMSLNGSETEIQVTDNMISGFDYTKAGKQEITITAYSAKTSFVIEILDYSIGDINGDNNIDNKDYALLMQYLNGWGVEIITTVSDVNNDGSIDNKDYAFLMQYLNGWNVVLG